MYQTKNFKKHSTPNLLAILTLVPLVLFLSIWIILSQIAKSGGSGTEFIALMTLLPLGFFIIAMLIGDVCYALIHLIKNKPRGKNLTITLLVLFLLPLCLFVLYVWTNNNSRLSEQRYKDSLSISRTEALRRVNNCEVTAIDSGGIYSNPELVTAPGSPYHPQNNNILLKDYDVIKSAIAQNKAVCKAKRATR